MKVHRKIIQVGKYAHERLLNAVEDDRNRNNK